MILSLEILQAFHGDCLLLHWGTISDPKLMIIDGGPSGVYDAFLKPRLVDIKQKRGLNKNLPITMVMVSHLDDDHANGICALTDEMVSNGNQREFDITHLWVNTFDDILGNNQLPGMASLTASSTEASISSLGLPNLDEIPEDELAVISSTSQGRQLRDNARFLTLAVNKPFPKVPGSDAIVVRGDSPKSKVPLAGLTITVVSPDQTRLIKLQKQWDKDLKKAKEKGDKKIITAAIASLDTSPFNLSSIACMVEAGGKKILLTGDGRGDFILEGLKKNNLLDSKNKLHVDILKMAHHGSIRNTPLEFFETVTADHYVISADGSNDNPDQGLLDIFISQIKKGTVYFTNKEGKKKILKKKMSAFEKEIKDSGSKLKIKFLDEGKPSFLIELGEKIDF